MNSKLWRQIKEIKMIYPLVIIKSKIIIVWKKKIKFSEVNFELYYKIK